MPKQVNLIYQLKGSAVDDGIDVFKLSPLLLSMGKLIQDSYEVSSQSPKQLAVNVKPFQRGSFIIDLQLYAANNLQQIIDVVNSDPVKEIKEVLDWIGLTAGVATYGVIQLMKFLKGQPKKFEKLASGDVRITAKDDTAITVNKSVFNLFQNTTIQNNLYEVYGNFLGKDGIDSVKSYIKDEPDNKVEVIKEDVPYFNPGNSVPIEEGDEEEKRNITKAYLKPKRISLEGEPDHWSFRRGKDVVITASVKDEEFLQKIVSGEIRLYSEDILEADLLEIQGIVNNEISLRYEVLKVREYKKAPVQGNLLS